MASAHHGVTFAQEKAIYANLRAIPNQHGGRLQISHFGLGKLFSKHEGNKSDRNGKRVFEQIEDQVLVPICIPDSLINDPGILFGASWGSRDTVCYVTFHEKPNDCCPDQFRVQKLTHQKVTSLAFFPSVTLSAHSRNGAARCNAGWSAT